MKRKIRKIVLTQPNYAWFGKRTWKYPPYTLSLLSDVLSAKYEKVVFDPNYSNLTEADIEEYFLRESPDVVGISSISTEYYDVAKAYTSLIRKVLPHAVLIFGGSIPTVMADVVFKEFDIDYCIKGEGER